MVFLRIFGLVLLMALALLPAQAQESDGTCPALVSEALSSIGSACSGAMRNSACYGYDRVSATFFEVQPDDLFDQAGDQAELGLVQTIRTAGLDPANGVWGLAMLHLQANIPEALPGQALTFLLMGDVEVENAVPQGETVTLAPVTANTNANIRSGPGTNFNVLGSAAVGQAFDADGLSADGQWVRINFNGEPAWINITLVTGDTSTLTTAQEGANLTPMQAIYLKTGLNAIECADAPASSLVVQGPQGLTVNFSVNGAQVEIGSTVVFQANEGDDGEAGRMQIAVLDGHAIADGVYIPTGHTSEVELDEEGLVVTETWTDAAPMTDEELSLYEPIAQLDGLPLAYDITLPTPQEIEEAALVDNPASSDIPAGAYDDYTAIMRLMEEYGLSPEEMATLSPEELQSRVMALMSDPEFQAFMAEYGDGSFDPSDFMFDDMGDAGGFDDFYDDGGGDPGFPDDGSGDPGFPDDGGGDPGFPNDGG
jgi:uncharacterized protein YgiM (DUF1202 family)